MVTPEATSRTSSRPGCEWATRLSPLLVPHCRDWVGWHTGDGWSAWVFVWYRDPPDVLLGATAGGLCLVSVRGRHPGRSTTPVAVFAAEATVPVGDGRSPDAHGVVQATTDRRHIGHSPARNGDRAPDDAGGVFQDEAATWVVPRVGSLSNTYSICGG